MSDYKEVKKDLDLEQYDLDTESKIEGTYHLPGSPGYVSNDEIKVHMVETDPHIDMDQEETKEKIIEEDFGEDIIETPLDDGELIKTSLEEEDLIETPLEGEELIETPLLEEEIITEEPYEEQKDFQTSTNYQENNYYSQNDNSNYSNNGKSGGGIPKFAFIGLGVVVLGLIAVMFFRGGNKSKDLANPLVGEWTPFAFQQEESIATFERDSKEFYFLDFREDNTVTLLTDGEEFNGTWELVDKDVAVDLGPRDSFNGIYEDEVFSMDIGFGYFHFNKIGSKASEKEKEIFDAAVVDTTFAELFGIDEDIEAYEEVPAVSVDESTEGPVHKPEKVLDTKEDLIGDWIGVVLELGHYGPEYEGSEMEQYDLEAVIDMDETGQYYFEAYFTDEPDEYPVLSTYIDMQEDRFMAIVGEEDAWIADHWLTPEEKGIISAKYDDPTTLYVQYDYEDYEAENSGFHLSFYFRKVGESWNDLPFKPSSLE